VVVGTGNPPRLRGGWHAGLARSASLVPAGCGGLVLSGGAWTPASCVSVVLGRPTAQNAMKLQASTGLRPACHPALRAGFALRMVICASEPALRRACAAGGTQGWRCAPASCPLDVEDSF
jgi:hypothetical protein